MKTYGLDDGDGNQITAGLPEHTARKTAQRMADERGKTLYLYPIPCPEGGDDDCDACEAEEIAPTTKTRSFPQTCPGGCGKPETQCMCDDGAR